MAYYQVYTFVSIDARGELNRGRRRRMMFVQIVLTKDSLLTLLRNPFILRMEPLLSVLKREVLRGAII